jgi:transposase
VIFVNKLFVGIDVSSQNNVSCLMDSDGVKYSSFSVQNNLGGAKLLTEKIVSAMKTLKLSDVVSGMESTSIYGNHLVYSLWEGGTLGRYQRKIHVLNPKQVSKFKEAYPDLPKNDWVDTFVIADCLRFGRIRSEVYMDDYRYEALKTLTRARFYAVQNLIREKQRFANQLFLKCSGLAQSTDTMTSNTTRSIRASINVHSL